MFAEAQFQPLQALSRRWLSRAFGWIPDVNNVPLRRMAAIGVALSIALHLLAFLLLFLWFMVLPHKVDRPPSAAAASAPRLEVVLTPRPAPSIAAKPQPKRREILDTEGLTAPEEKPENAEFESDKDLVAASENPATGMLNLPTQDGRTDLPGLDFATQDVRIGVSPTDTNTRGQDKEPAAPAPPVSPLYKPQPIAKEQLEQAEKAKPADALPEPAKAVRATPPPLKFTDQPNPNSVPIARATPVPETLAMNTPPATETKSSFSERYKESLQKTRIDGSITNRGKASVNAINTPMGRYERRIGQQAESIWIIKTRSNAGMLNTSSVRVRFKIQPDGKIVDIEVLSDGGDPRHAQLCVDTLRTMRPEPLPAEAEPLMVDGGLEREFSFTLF